MPTVEMLENGNVKLSFKIALRSRAGRKRIIAPEVMELPADPIVKNIVRAYRWQEMIDRGDFANVHELANATGKDHSYVARTLRLIYLCPEIIHAALMGTLPNDVTLTTLLRTTMDDWTEQKKFVGLK